MNDILIRQAEESDLGRIEELMTELVEAVDSTEGLDLHAVSENYQVLLKDENSYILVAETDGVVVGVINFIIRRTILHPGLSGLIDEIVVARSHRGGGIGKRLIYAAIEKCQQLGCCELEVSTEFTNTNARSFYKSCGFEEMGPLLERDLG